MKLLKDKGIELPFWTTEKPDKDCKKDIKKYGIDPRECFSLDYAFTVWIYQRLIIYKRDASTVVDLEFHKFKIKDSEYTLLECVEKMIDLLEEYLKDDFDYIDWRVDEEGILLDEFMDIFSICWRALWW